MRIHLAAAIAALTIGVSAAPAFAKTETVTGTVVDLVCYKDSAKNIGMDHGNARECAWSCIKWEGQPVGLVTAEGKVYELAGGIVKGNNALLAPHLTHTVTVTGDVVDRDGMMTITATDLTMVKK